MTQSSKKFRKTIDTVFASANRVMKMCHEDVEIVEGYDNSFAYSSGDKHVTVSAYVNCEEFEYVPPSKYILSDDMLGRYFRLLVEKLYYMSNL